MDGLHDPREYPRPRVVQEPRPRTLNNKIGNFQDWGAGAGAGRSRVFLAPWSRSRLKKKQ